MGVLRDQETIGEVWTRAVRRYGERAFIAIPAGSTDAANGLELTYTQADSQIGRLIEGYRRAGYGPGHRAALLLENRVEHVLHKLALNAIGVSCVPINPDLRPAEIAYLVEHSEPEIVLTIGSRARQAADALDASAHKPPLLIIEDGKQPPAPRRSADSGAVTPATEASILYTSGTTGRPKGCILSHGYEIACGAWYAQLPGVAGLRAEADRIYNPLPLYHVNAGVLSLFGAICTGCCQVQPERFRAQRWWTEIAQSRATIVHYLGIVIQALMRQEDAVVSRQHKVRFGLGAGAEPQLHAAFEARFGFPLVEVWGMTEMVRVLADSVEPRQVATRAFGRAAPGIEIRVVDEADRDVPDGTPGEMLFRHSAETPRRGAFSGYLKNDAETEKAWRGGWFHTGDTVNRGADGMLHFLDRKKNIIRRSGENIAAAEVEALLLAHPSVAQAAVLAVKDEVREEEVLACVVLKSGKGDLEAAQSIFNFCSDRLAYFKAPGWIWFADCLPTTGTQKIQKHAIFPSTTDPRTLAGMIDLRESKRRIPIETPARPEGH
jgi:acyl-CoA synthetase (AMP-forming)/AMP-acid ligase II